MVADSALSGRLRPAPPQGDGSARKVTPVPFLVTLAAGKATPWSRKVALFTAKLRKAEFFPWTPFQVFHPPRRRRRFLPLLALFASAPLWAKDDLGVFDEWAAFRDTDVPRCYAITAAERGTSAFPAYADVANWPRQGVRGQVHFRLSRELADNPRLSVSLGRERFELTGGGVDAWAPDRRTDAAIVAAMRSQTQMSLSATDRAGRRFTDRYSLAGGATAMDAATVGCAAIR
jgi:hypothetical protein